MPLEGAWQRQNTPLPRLTLREGRLLWIVVGLTTLATAVLVVLVVVAGSAKVPRGCVRLTSGGTTGAILVHPCGADAISFCRTQALRSDDFAGRAKAACRQ